MRYLHGAKSKLGGNRVSAPTIIASFEDGPLAGETQDAEVLEGRPPKTLDVAARDGTTCRYCLEGWMQSGKSARYTFLYRV